jgi:hypothetical protein
MQFYFFRTDKLFIFVLRNLTIITTNYDARITIKIKRRSD